MIAVIFEGIPSDGKMEEYLAMAPKYKDPLTKIEGFISNERFQSCSNPAKVLSISFWEDESSIRQFREFEIHLEDERKGREGLFSDYRIRITKVFRDYSLNERKDAPQK
jgi:heme-degrading monooxygenase HmoA